MILDDLLIGKAAFEKGTGWALKPHGACKGEHCVPFPSGTIEDGRVDLRTIAKSLGMALVEDIQSCIWALGPESAPTGRALATAVAPELQLPQLDGTLFSLSSLRGRKVVLVSWATWCGCRVDLPLWQELRQQLHGKGLEIVTVALDSGSYDQIRPWIERASPQHPSLIDADHKVDALFGVTNVPNGVWIDEEGMIVRPAEPAWLLDPAKVVQDLLDSMENPPEELLATSKEVKAMRVDADIYRMMIVDWVEKGSDSIYALPPEAVVERSLPRGLDESAAAAHFEIGLHLERSGRSEEAVEHFKKAHALQPDNWTFKRQAWDFKRDTFEVVGKVAGYGTGWLEEIRKAGPENYYTPIVGTRA